MENQKRIEQNWLDCPVIKAFPGFSREKLIITLIIILAILSRFLLLGNRVMSHDEVNHVVPAYNLYKGMGYAHDPVTHGPFQFHVLALAYFLFGDNDFASRVPAALFSVAAIIFVIFAFKRYLGRIGALIGGVLFLISPFLLLFFCSSVSTSVPNTQLVHNNHPRRPLRTHARIVYTQKTCQNNHPQTCHTPLGRGFRYVPFPSTLSIIPCFTRRLSHVDAVPGLMPVASACSRKAERVNSLSMLCSRASRSALLRRLISVPGRKERMCVAWR